MKDKPEDLFARRITQKNAEGISVSASLVVCGPKKSARKCEKSEKPFSAILQRQPVIVQAVPTRIAQNDFSDFSRNSRGVPGGGANDFGS
jgi:hypothetical protein